MSCEEMGALLAHICLGSLEKVVPKWAANADEAVGTFTQTSERPFPFRGVWQRVARRFSTSTDSTANFRRELSALVVVFHRIATEIFGPNDPDLRRRVVDSFDRTVDAGLDDAFRQFADSRLAYYGEFFEEHRGTPNFGHALACRFSQFWQGGENSPNEPLRVCDAFEANPRSIIAVTAVGKIFEGCKNVYRSTRVR